MNPIVGYIHVCKIGEWKRSFGMLVDALRASGLYDTASVIRLGVVRDDTDEGKEDEEEDEMLQDPKFKIVVRGGAWEYERITLHHMREKAELEDHADTRYFYLHTKGLRHFGTPRESNVVDWINVMLYWNVERWSLAVAKLADPGVSCYGCLKKPAHFHGNFWWTKRSHLVQLPRTIGWEYVDPEFYILKGDGEAKCYSAFDTGQDHYLVACPRARYAGTAKKR